MANDQLYQRDGCRLNKT